MGRLHSKILSVGPYGKYLDITLLRVFETKEINTALIDIYMHIQEWDKAEMLLLGFFECTSVIDYCNSQERVPLFFMSSACNTSGIQR